MFKPVLLESDLNGRVRSGRHGGNRRSARSGLCPQLVRQSGDRNGRVGTCADVPPVSPVYELLGWRVSDLTIRSRFSLGAYEPEQAAARASRACRCPASQRSRVKVGGVAELDIARVRAVRAAAGEDIALVIDANCGWDAETAIEAIRALDDCRLSLVEQPTPDGDYAAAGRGSVAR